MPERYALIVGSGFEGMVDGDRDPVRQTRFGEPSAPVMHGRIAEAPVLMLSRHGEAHTVPPHAINYRANLLTLEEAGATAVIALNTVGVISEICNAGELAVPDQLLDYTWDRAQTIFDGSDRIVEHIDFTEPFTGALRKALLAAAETAGVDCHGGGVYAVTQGPRLETAAEVDRLERDGADFVGMTAMPEAAIARELGLDYACLALVVNKAAGRGELPIHADVEASIAQARTRAESLLQGFFEGIDGMGIRA